MCILIAITEGIAQDRSKMILVIECSSGLAKDSVELTSVSSQREFVTRERSTLYLSQCPVTKVFNADVPLLITGRGEETATSFYCILEPGDSLVVSYKNDDIVLSGVGVEKNLLKRELLMITDAMKRPSNPFRYYTYSLDDYWEWNAYLDKQMSNALSLIEQRKNILSPKVYQLLKVETILHTQEQKHDKFRGLYSLYIKNGSVSGISREMLAQIFDKTFFNSDFNWMRSQKIGLSGDLGFVKDLIERNGLYPREYDSLAGGAIGRLREYYEVGKKMYAGDALESFLIEMMTTEVIYDEGYKKGFGKQVDTLLQHFYSDPAIDLEAKQMVRSSEEKYRQKSVGAGAVFPSFSFRDKHGRYYKNQDFEGKFVIFNFNTEVEKKLDLSGIADMLSNDPRMLVVNAKINKVGKGVHVKKTKNSKPYVTYNQLDLYPSPDDDISSLIKTFQLQERKNVFILNEKGTILANFPTDFDRSELRTMLKERLNVLADGPYIVKEGEQNASYEIGQHGDLTRVVYGKNSFIEVNTDILGKSFEIKLKDTIYSEPVEFDKPSKIMALSDIEGNFKSFRELLQANKVIDTNFRWCFDSGHLVINGDMFDRGEQVTECLWLIYKLEDEAREAGGYVHFILGNHEIMNLSGNHRYVKDKYKRNSKKIGRRYSGLFDEYSELGKWLRSKNIAEKVGDLLFVHGGISPEVCDLEITLHDMNAMAKNYYDKDTVAARSSDNRLAALYNVKISPFWYRQYYLENETKVTVSAGGIDTTFRTPESVIDKTLKLYNVNHIVTGHTIIKGNTYGKYVTTHYSNKVINTDTHHAKGDTEALMFDRNVYYRVNKEGMRVLLFSQPAAYTLK